MDWLGTLKALAPTVASAFGGPLAGIAVSAVGKLLGVTEATQERVAEALTNGSLTPEQISEIKLLELKYQSDEKERGFRYTELAFKDRDSARSANVAGKTQIPLFWLSLFLLAVTLGTECSILFLGYPQNTSEIVVGRVLGLMDAVTMLVLAYWYGTTNGSAQKNDTVSRAIK